MTEVIKFDKEDRIGRITIDNPPANALSFAVVKGIANTVANFVEDTQLSALIISGAGKMFVAGADIREFNMARPKDVPELHNLINSIEESPKPIIAALNGLALGGGLELAMGCHFRVAHEKALLGQPEVKLGIIPGAGGTQRLPRLVGAEMALKMIVGGEPISAKEAVGVGLVDEILMEDFISDSIAFAKKVMSGGTRPTGKIKLEITDSTIFDKWRDKIKPKSRGLDAPYECVSCVEAAFNNSFEKGLELERKIFVNLRDGEKSKAMRHMFFAEREINKVPGLSKNTETLDINTAAVVGAGTMGGGIAMNFANAGIPVKLLDISKDAVETGIEIIRKNYNRSVASGRFTQETVEKRMELITGTTDYQDLSQVDIVIEAVFEDMELKKGIFIELEKVCKSEAILASNTSSLDINEIAKVTNRPEKVCGTHFFSPANVMKLMENVRAKDTSIETVATIMRLSKTLKKTGVLVGVGDGFVGNRMMHVAARVAEFMVEEGALPWQIDEVIYNFGFPMGPFAMNDLAGVDVRYSIRQEQKKLYGDRRQSIILENLYQTGRFGQKTNGGWYTYDKGERKGRPEPEVETLIVETSEQLGFKRREFSDQEILDRYLAALINTGAHVLEERLAMRGSDIDVIWNYGYGFPRYRGGPMFYADQVGLDKIYKSVCNYNTDYGDWLRPSVLLERLASEGGSLGKYSID